jgi:hypothetical protein
MIEAWSGMMDEWGQSEGVQPILAWVYACMHTLANWQGWWGVCPICGGILTCTNSFEYAHVFSYVNFKRHSVETKLTSQMQWVSTEAPRSPRYPRRAPRYPRSIWEDLLLFISAPGSAGWRIRVACNASLQTLTRSVKKARMAGSLRQIRSCGS